uniref:Tyrosine-protein kinase n=1 Tax=Trichuris muris TaxID=70415 RepID=A0A5S6R615_TRIMR
MDDMDRRRRKTAPPRTSEKKKLNKSKTKCPKGGKGKTASNGAKRNRAPLATRRKVDLRKSERAALESEQSLQRTSRRRTTGDYEVPERIVKSSPDSQCRKKSNERANVEETPPKSKRWTKTIEQCNFYHFCLSRKDAEDILFLKASGSFLVRVTKEHEWGFMFCVSVIQVGEIWHIKVKVDDKGHFYLANSFHAPEVCDVIMHHMKNKVPLSIGVNTSRHAMELLLIYPVERLDWEIIGSQISIERKELGEGEFGAVYKGKLRRGNHVVAVALKSLRNSEDDQAREDLLREGRLMRRLGKSNKIVAFIGITISTTATMLLIEYVNGGSFDHILRNDQPDKRTIGQILRDAARGMVHLKLNRIIHRDVATRNILVSKKNGKLVRGKISDFGMSRYLLSENYREMRVGRLPVRWSAPETLEQKVWSFETDAWMFGITLWEAFNGATIPFYELEPMDLDALLKYIQTGARPTPMGTIPKELRPLLDRILDIDPKKRTPISDVADALQHYCKTANRALLTTKPP